MNTLLGRIKKIINYSAIAAFLVAFFVFASAGLAAWQDPTASPPANNPPGFIQNISDVNSSAQVGNIKISGQGIADILKATSQICLGTGTGNCKTSWSEISGFWQAGTGSAIYYNNAPVGIGTSVPSSLYGLHVINNGSGEYGISAAGNVRGLYAVANDQSGYGVYGYANGDASTGVRASGGRYGVYASGKLYGLYAFNSEDGGYAVFASGGLGTNSTGLLARGSKYAIYSATGDNYFVGNVGIGRATPGAKLEVSGDIVVDANSTNNGTFGANTLKFGGYGSGEGIGSARVSGSPNRYGLDFYTGVSTGGVRMSITNTGDVGIGTVSPTAKLEVAGKIKVDGGMIEILNGSTPGIKMAGSFVYDGYDDTLHIRSGGDKVIFDGADKVGINVTTPNYNSLFQVNGGPFLVSGLGGRIYLGGNANQDPGSTLVWGIDNDFTKGLRFFSQPSTNVAGTERMTLGQTSYTTPNGTGYLAVGTGVAAKELQLTSLSSAPSVTASKIYNFGGSLYWNGQPISTGSFTEVDPTWNNGGQTTGYITRTGGIGVQAPSGSGGFMNVMTNSAIASGNTYPGDNYQYSGIRFGSIGVGSGQSHWQITYRNGNTPGYAGEAQDLWFSYKNSADQWINPFIITEGGQFGMGTVPGNTLRLRVAGRVGAGEFCDEDETDCKTIGEVTTGGGTTNNISKWTSSRVLGNSIIIDDGTNVGIGITPTHKLTVNGYTRIDLPGTAYDVWIQGGSSTSGDARNLALLGLENSDKLYLNYNNEYDNGTFIQSNVNIGTSATVSTARLHINPGSGQEGIRIISDANTSPLNIMNTSNVDIFRVDQTGTLVFGNIPWARLTGIPANVGTTYTAGTGLTLAGTVFSHTAHTGDVTGATSLTIANNAVTSAKILDDTITASDIAANAVGTSEIANNAVSGNKILDGAVTNTKIYNGSITADKIGTGAVVEAKIGTGAVTNYKIGKMGATSGQVLKWNGTFWAPAADTDTNTTYSLSSVLCVGTIDRSACGLATCGNISWSGGCSNIGYDEGSDEYEVQCPPGYVVAGGGGNCGGDRIEESRPSQTNRWKFNCNTNILDASVHCIKLQ